jgi:hypothetical protein
MLIYINVNKHCVLFEYRRMILKKILRITRSIN